MRNKSILYWLLALLCVLIWGTSWSVFAIGLRYMSPFLFGGAANLLAGVILLGAARVRNTPIPRTASARRFYVLVGVVYSAMPAGLMFWGMRYISSGMASVLVWTSSLFLVGLAFVFLRHYERVTLQKLIGVVTGFGGVAAIFGDDLHVGFESPSLMGMLALLCAGLCVALGIVIVKRSGSRYHPSIIACARAVVGGLLLMLTAFTFSQTQFAFSWEVAGAVLFVGLLVYGGADLLFLWLLQRLEAVKLSLVGLLAPVIALFVGFFFFQETVTTLDIIGTGLVISGLVAVNIG